MMTTRTPRCRKCGCTDQSKLIKRSDRVVTVCRPCEAAYKRTLYERRAAANRRHVLVPSKQVSRAERGERVMSNPWQVVHDPDGTLTGAEMYPIEVAYGLNETKKVLSF